MVKGISKHAVIVPSPDPGRFEQAIFIVADNHDCGVGSADEMLAVAYRLASRCTISEPATRWPVRISRIAVPVLTFLLGSGAATAAWFLLGL